jgi:hypothetical protein
MTWKVTSMFNSFGFVGFAGGTSLYQRVSVAGVMRVDGTSRDVGGGVDVVEVYRC